MQQRELTVVLVTLFVIIYFGIANSAFYTTRTSSRSVSTSPPSP